jgi:hypothetical protein
MTKSVTGAHAWSRQSDVPVAHDQSSREARRKHVYVVVALLLTLALALFSRTELGKAARNSLAIIVESYSDVIMRLIESDGRRLG